MLSVLASPLPFLSLVFLDDPHPFPVVLTRRKMSASAALAGPKPWGRKARRPPTADDVER